MNIVIQILIILVLAVLSLSVYYVIKVKILSKYHIKKRYVILAMAIVIFSPFVILLANKNAKLPQWIFNGQMIVFTVIFLVYLEILRMDKIRKNKPVVGKPKPNPNRAKNIK